MNENMMKLQKIQREILRKNILQKFKNYYNLNKNTSGLIEGINLWIAISKNVYNDDKNPLINNFYNDLNIAIHHSSTGVYIYWLNLEIYVELDVCFAFLQFCQKLMDNVLE